MAVFPLTAQVAQRKKKDLSSGAVDGLAMNSFQTSSCCVFQVRYYKLHKQNVSDGLAVLSGDRD